VYNSDTNVNFYTFEYILYSILLRFWQQKRRLNTQKHLNEDIPNAEGTGLDGGYSKIFEIKNYSNATSSVDVVGEELTITGDYI